VISGGGAYTTKGGAFGVDGGDLESALRGQVCSFRHLLKRCRHRAKIPLLALDLCAAPIEGIRRFSQKRRAGRPG
jgi:hypothetical protein